MTTSEGWHWYQALRNRPVGRPRASRLIWLVVIACLPGCAQPRSSTESSASASGALAIKGAGSTFVAPLMNAWITAYRASHSDVAMAYDVVGSGEGVRRFIGRDLAPGEQIDFGASDSAMSDGELSQAGGETLMLPVTGACVVLAYHVTPLRSELRLSRRAYVGIFLGQITRWNDPLIQATNPGLALPDRPIGLAVRQDSSGTTFAFSQHLGAVSQEWRRRFPASTSVGWVGDAMRANGNEGVAGLIKTYNGMIGYVGYEFAQKLDLDVASLENRRGEFVKPTPESCSAGLATAEVPENLRAFTPDPDAAGAYPIVTFSWVLLRQHTTGEKVHNELRTFFQWCLEAGQTMAGPLGYVPLPSSVVSKAVKALATE